MNNNHKPLKKAFSLIELILSILIMSVVVTFSFKTFENVISNDKESFLEEKVKLEILNTKLILEKSSDLSSLNLNNNTLYLYNSVLLKNVSNFTKNTFEKYDEINICIQNIICQKMVVLK